MIPQVRLGIAPRVFCVAAVLGLSLALTDSTALQGTLLLAAVAAIAVAAEASVSRHDRWVISAEALLASLVVGMALPQGVLLLPYLVVPALIAGLTLGVWPVLTTVSIEVLGLGAVVLLTGRAQDVQALAEVVGPWLATTLGVGLLAVRLRSLRAGGTAEADSSYESARRLLSQLRTVARRLSSGLDTVSMSGQLLTAVHDHLDDTHAALFVRSEGGVLAPLAYRGPGARDALKAEGELVDRCWTEMEPQHDIVGTGDAARRHAVVLPLRVGARMVGLVIARCAQPPDAKAVATLMNEVDEHALRIETALAFDEIRSIATMEERHRLAREIHDGVAQEIASLGYVVDDLAATSTSESQNRKLQSLRAELTRVVSELRLSIFDLRSELSAGLGSSLSDYVREMGARSGLTVHMTLDVAPTRLRGEVETELLRIAQEAITNARKHSGATNLWVDCRIRPPHARISIRDDGTGLGTPRDDSYGLAIMRERSQRIGADLDISCPDPRLGGSGTIVTVTVGADEHSLT